METEGKGTHAIEKQTQKIPSFTFMGIALGSIALSAGLFLAGKKDWSNFVGLWAPTILITGLYNKMVKELVPTPSSSY